MNLETPIGYENAKSPDDLKNAVFLVQAQLMNRYPGGEADWVERYAAPFRRLYDTDEEFRSMLTFEMTPDHLRKLQERLDEAP